MKFVLMASMLLSIATAKLTGGNTTGTRPTKPPADDSHDDSTKPPADITRFDPSHFNGTFTDLSKTCNATQLTACASTNIPACRTGVLPAFKGCCLSCKAVKLVFNSTQINTCMESLKALPDCTSASNTFNPTIGCVTCKKPARTHAKHTCTNTHAQTHLSQVRNCTFTTEFSTLRTCEQDEPPQFEGCSKTCKRAESTCSIESAASCIASRSDCQVDQPPSLVAGECCLSCNPVKPARCANCTHTKRAFQLQGVTSSAAAFAGSAKNCTKSVQAAVLEIVARFCEDATNADVCIKYQQSVVTGLNVTSVNQTQGSVGLLK